MPLLVGLTGLRGSGKNTAADFITEWGGSRGLTVAQHGLADKLKHSALLALGLDVSEADAVVLADSLKFTGEVSMMIPDQSVGISITGRSFLQRYGTEAHREIFGDSFWIDALIPMGEVNYLGVRGNKWHENFGHADICLVTDVRFDNEAERVRNLGGIVWEVVRPGIESDGHQSENGVHRRYVDLIIPNAGSMDEFKNEVLLCCNSYLTGDEQ